MSTSVTEQIETARPIDHLPPNDVESEAATVGSILMDPQAIYRVQSTLQAVDFYRDRNAEIYRAAVAMCDRGEPVDMVTISSELKARGVFDEIGGLPYLSSLIGIVPTAVHIEHYAGRVMAAAYRRRLISVAGKMAGVANDETLDLEAVRSRSWTLLTGLEAGRSHERPMSGEDQAVLFWDMLGEIERDERTTVPTGIADLDRLTDGGLDRAQLTILMALPGMGKSAMGQTIGRYMGAHGTKGLFCSVEMSKRQLLKRTAAALLRMDWHVFRRRWRHLREEPDGGAALSAAVLRATEQMQASGMRIWYVPGMTTTDIRVEAMEMKGNEGLDWILVDYLQILADGDSGDRANRNEQVGRMCRNLKRLAGELDVPVLALSQMSRDYKTRTDKRPVMSDARDSGEIEQHVDLLLGLYRDDFFYKPGDAIDATKGIYCTAGKAELLLLKQREGPPGTCHLQWIPELCEYVSAANEQGRPAWWSEDGDE